MVEPRRHSSLAVTRFQIPIDPLTGTATLRSSWGILAISPDGTRLVYAANRQLYLRSMAEMDTRPIPGTNLDVFSPFFSPDGQWIGFFSGQDQTLKKIAVTGGAALTLCKLDAGPAFGGATWDRGQIVFTAPGKGIMRVSADGGVPEILAAVDASSTAFGPQLIDEGRAVLFTVTHEAGVDRWDKAEIVVQPVGSTERSVIVRGGSDGRYLPTGHLVYALAERFSPFRSTCRNGRRQAVPFRSSTVSCARRIPPSAPVSRTLPPRPPERSSTFRARRWRWRPPRRLRSRTDRENLRQSGCPRSRTFTRGCRRTGRNSSSEPTMARKARCGRTSSGPVRCRGG
jgi:hypothetical protein